MTIKFGTVKETRNGAYQKYADKPVMTVEGWKGAGRSRRVLFNRATETALKIEEGSIQEIILGFIEADENGNKRLLITNTDALDAIEEGTPTYSLSKNRVAFEDSKEKGKSISSSRLHQEINNFLELDEVSTHEYELVAFENPGDIELYELVKVSDGTQSLNDELVVEEEVAVEAGHTPFNPGEAIV